MCVCVCMWDLDSGFLVRWVVGERDVGDIYCIYIDAKRNMVEWE